MSTVRDMIHFASNYTDMIAIGGGEPTLHPQFWDILKECLDTFDGVWFATNGTNTKIMWKLAALLDEWMYYDKKDESTYIGLTHPNQLGVALSTDWAHDSSKVNEKIRALWERRAAGHNRNGYETRDVFRSGNGAAAQGRAKRTGSGWGTHCVCSDTMIKPDGTLRLCGCTGQPSAGDVWSGYTAAAERKMKSKRYEETSCYFGK